MFMKKKHDARLNKTIFVSVTIYLYCMLVTYLHNAEFHVSMDTNIFPVKKHNFHFIDNNISVIYCHRYEIVDILRYITIKTTLISSEIHPPS